MQRKGRMALGNAIIAASSIIGGVLLTNYLTADAGGLFPASNASNTKNSGTDQTVQSDSIQYRYGTVQVEVVQSGGKISAIKMLQSGATAGREQAYPMLVQAALSAQGTTFGNISGATFTTDAFKQALSSALSKLG